MSWCFFQIIALVCILLSLCGIGTLFSTLNYAIFHFSTKGTGFFDVFEALLMITSEVRNFYTV